MISFFRLKCIVHSHASRLMITGGDEERERGREARVGTLAGAAPVSAKIIYREATFREIPWSRSLTVVSQLSFAFAFNGENLIESARAF